MNMDVKKWVKGGDRTMYSCREQSGFPCDPSNNTNAMALTCSRLACGAFASLLPKLFVLAPGTNAACGGVPEATP